MEEQVYSLQYEVEKQHWWFAARLQILLHFLASRIPPSKSVRLLDVGCGTGAVLEALSQRYDAYGIDSSHQAIEFCTRRGLKNVRVASLGEMRGGPSFDLITMFDVVEHVENDHGLLHDAHALLKSGGRLVVSVPAFPSLWSSHDEVLHHKRRYTKDTLRDVVSANRFEIVDLTFFNTLLFPVAVMKRWLGKIIGNDAAGDLALPAPWVNAVLREVFSLERPFIPHAWMPFGLSLLCHARKP